MKKTLFTVLACAALFSACNKDDNNNASAKDRVTGKWMLTDFSRYVFVGSSNFTVKQYDSLQACEKDDLYLFNADNTLLRDENTQKCRSTDPQQRSLGTYAITTNDTRLIMPNPDQPSQVDTLEIVELTSSTLRTRTLLQPGVSNGIQDTKTYSKR